MALQNIGTAYSARNSPMLLANVFVCFLIISLTLVFVGNFFCGAIYQSTLTPLNSITALLYAMRALSLIFLSFSGSLVS